MIKNMARLPLDYNKLPIKIKNYQFLNSFYLLQTEDNSMYRLYEVSSTDYLKYQDLSRTDCIKKAIFEYQQDGKYYLLFSLKINSSEDLAKVNRMLIDLEKIFQKYSYSITLKKESLKRLGNIYKVLDDKFVYLEFRIREIETRPNKNDICWITLAKYYIILDAKMYLYDLQQDLFKLLETDKTIEYGLIFRNVLKQDYDDKFFMPLDLYYGPIAMLYCRFYLSFDNYDIDKIIEKKISKLDTFNQKYFCFMYLYIIIISLEMDIMNQNIDSYLYSVKKISNFIKKFGGYLR